MSYLTIKHIKGNPYLYQVRSEREGDRVRQVFEAYLGRADEGIESIRERRGVSRVDIVKSEPVVERPVEIKDVIIPVAEVVETPSEEEKIDEILRRFEEEQKAKIPTREEYVEGKLAEYKSELEGSGFPLDVKYQTEIINREAVNFIRELKG